MYFYFDTSAIPDDAVVASAVVYLYVSDQGGTNPGLRIYCDPNGVYPSESGGSPNLSLGDFDLDNYALRDTISGAVIAGSKPDWFTADILAGDVDVSGLTKICVTTEECAAASGQPYYVEIHTANGTNKPYLKVTYYEQTSNPWPNINISDVFKPATEMKINIGDAWKDVVEVKINIGDTWKDLTT